LAEEIGAGLCSWSSFGSIVDHCCPVRLGRPRGKADRRNLRPRRAGPPRAYLRQLVLNPCAGHPPETLDIHNSDVFETLREFAAMDGAFVVNGNGILKSAATYLDAPVRDLPLRAGFGARHVAALGVTIGAGAVAVVVSSSSGTISVFQDGRLILELEKS
jgi:DNA integrity scanning protein DisA with diadenylate cyclase activity